MGITCENGKAIFRYKQVIYLSAEINHIGGKNLGAPLLPQAQKGSKSRNTWHYLADMLSSPPNSKYRIARSAVPSK
jgi:hypothetical protein